METQTAARRRDHDLIVRAQAGDDEAARTLVMAHRRLAWRLAGDFARRPEDVADLAQTGVLGLYDAIEEFDTGRDVKFFTYARHHVFKRIREERAATGRFGTLALGAAWRNRIYGAKAEALASAGRPSAGEDVAEALGWSAVRLETVRRAQLFQGRDGVSVQSSDQEILDGAAAPAAEPDPDRRDNLDRALAALAALDDRQRTVVSARLGLAPFDRQHGLLEIGAMMGLTRERVRQLELKALTVLRHRVGGDALRAAGSVESLGIGIRRPGRPARAVVGRDVPAPQPNPLTTDGGGR